MGILVLFNCRSFCINILNENFFVILNELLGEEESPGAFLKIFTVSIS
jgi:hypothetical protein